MPLIDLDQADVLSCDHFERHVRREDPGEHAAERFEARANVERSRRHDVLTGECQQLSGKHRRPIGGRAHLGEPDARLLIQAVLHQQDVGVAADDREQVVEVVCDAAGQASYRLHLLGVVELVLDVESLGVVREHHAHSDDRLAGIAYREIARLPMAAFSEDGVGGGGRRDVHQRPSGGEHGLEPRRDHDGDRRHHLMHRLADEPRRRLAVRVGEHRVHPRVSKLAIEKRDADGHGGECRVEQRRGILPREALPRRGGSRASRSVGPAGVHLFAHAGQASAAGIS